MALTNPDQQVTKGLFTKELEAALLSEEADLAVHSLKDLPTELPEGLELGAVCEREDARDVLIYRAGPDGGTDLGAGAGARLARFPSGATIATSSTRRQAQLLAIRPDLKVVPIRGNVGTRLQKLAGNPELDGLVLAAAGLNRLHLLRDGRLEGKGIPPGLGLSYFSASEMIPCVGQAAIGIEVRARDERMAELCRALDDSRTHACVAAERAFLQAMGGGCLSPVAAYATLEGDELCLRAVSFRDERVRRGEATGAALGAVGLGRELAAQLNGP
jgi:hydroxymethylbilane synthase